MSRLFKTVSVFLLLASLAGGAVAQTRAETLADIRQELGFLFVEMQRLNQELSTTGSSGSVADGTMLQRLDALEGELRRITGKVEELEFRITNIVKDGTNRIGDLEFRLVELEGGDVSKLGETSTLGGDLNTPDPVVVDPPAEPSTELAVSEQVDFETAKQAYDNGEYLRSSDLFSAFADNYPGGPLTPQSHYWRGRALANQEEWSDAARSFLQSFSSAPQSDVAPGALFRLGVSLDRIGQRDEACLTLNEVGLRYPDSAAALDAGNEMDTLGCNP